MPRRHVIGLVAGVMLAGLLIDPSALPAQAAVIQSLSDAPSADDEAAARAVAERFGHPVTVDSETSETALVQAQPDGTMLLTATTEPARARRDGSWVPLDTTLTPTGTGTLAAAAAAVPVQFSGGGSAALAKVRTPSGQWLSESWLAGDLPAPEVRASTATYPEVYPGVDLVLTATPTGMSQVLVVKDAVAAANPALAKVGFGIDDGTLTASATAGGTALVTGADGSTQLASGIATWWDSSAPGSSPAGPGSLDLPRPMPATVTDTAVVLNAAVPARTAGVTFPVYVDPPWTGGTVAWGYVDRAYPDTAYWKGTGGSDAYQHVGYVDAAHSDDGRAHTTRAYWQLDTSGLNNQHIKQADLYTTEVYSYSCTPSTVDLYTSSPVTPSSTWNHQPGLPANPETSASAAYGYSASCPWQDKNVHFTVTAPVGRAAAASSDVINFALLARDETSNSGWKKFKGAASLVVQYESFPSHPTDLSISDCWAGVGCGYDGTTRNQQPALTARAAVAYAQDTLDYTYQVCIGRIGSIGGCLTTFYDRNKVSGDLSSVQVPSALADSPWVYRVTACLNHDAAVCGETTGWFPFTVKNHGPTAAPAVTSPLFSSAVDHVPGTVSFAPGTGSNGQPETGIYAYAYSTTSGVVAITAPGCPAQQGDVYLVCAGTSTSATIIPTGSAASLTVWELDLAGNASPAFSTSYPVQAPQAAAPTHAWLESSASAGATSIGDFAGGSSATPLTLGSGVSWLSPTGLSKHTAALSLASPNAAAVTAGPALALDSTHSATIAAWVRPTAGGAHAAVSLQTAYSAFTLGESAAGTWQMCMPRSLTAASVADCATSQQTADTSGTKWVLLVGIWDAVTKTITLEVFPYRAGSPPLGGTYDSANAETSPAVSHTATAPGNPAPVTVGAATVGGSPAQSWVGAIADPAVYNTVLPQDQIESLTVTPPWTNP